VTPLHLTATAFFLAALGVALWSIASSFRAALPRIRQLLTPPAAPHGPQSNSPVASERGGANRKASDMEQDEAIKAGAR
jgi:hypothetical protein